MQLNLGARQTGYRLARGLGQSLSAPTTADVDERGRGLGRIAAAASLHLRETQVDTAVLGVGPAADDDLAPRVEVDALAAVDVRVAKEP